MPHDGTTTLQSTRRGPRNVLYISPNGLTEPHVASQIIPYLRNLVGENRFVLVTLEKPSADPAAVEKVVAGLTTLGIRSIRIPYGGWPWGTLRTLPRLRRVVRALVRKGDVDLVHARSYFAAEAARPICRRAKVPLLFDMRGFYVDERVDGGLLRKSSLLYRWLKRREARLLRQSDEVLVLTHHAKRLLQDRTSFPVQPPRVDVVPCAVDLDVFTPSAGPAPPGFRVAYTGSLGTFYDHEGMARAFAEVWKRRPDATFHVASLQSTDALAAALERQGVPEAALHTGRARPHEVPDWLRSCHAGICFLTPTFSKHASQAIKVAEYLACGLPILVNAGSGDYEDFVERQRVGVVVPTTAAATLPSAVERWLALALDRTTRARCRKVAEDRFDARAISRTYAATYERLAPRI